MEKMTDAEKPKKPKLVLAKPASKSAADLRTLAKKLLAAIKAS